MTDNTGKEEGYPVFWNTNEAGNPPVPWNTSKFVNVPGDPPSLEAEVSRVRTGLSAASAASKRSTWSERLAEEVDEAVGGIKPACAFTLQLVREHPCLVLVCFAMVGIGVTVGMVIEKWEFLTSLYVLVQITTTIGYGDVLVSSEWMRMFMALYVLLSLVIVANCLNIIMKSIIEQHIINFSARITRMKVESGKLNRTRRKEQQLSRLGCGCGHEVLASSVLLIGSILAGTLFYRFAEECTCSYGVTRTSYGKMGCNDETASTCKASGGFQHTWVSAFYMSVITVWMATGVTATAFFISAVSKQIARRPQKQVEGAEAINAEIFKEIDKNGDGHLTKAEYTRYILLRHGFLPRKVLRDIDDKYDSMDIFGSGKVTLEMIQQAAARNSEMFAQKAATF
ncbi:unnamed protein product [Polarella glacialis]|uniref:EF-hand domain-containing protein n=1 Tax=Polarella glacialis TaxID=89957 RepID=A0A813LFU6_POLGL|nr:unnamed protein product [Polarella glacialis]